MRVLGLETATSVCGAAIVEEEAVLAERWTHEQHVHSERIVRFVEEVLSESRLELRELDGVAVSIGPGSFTGLRIGLSVAKGLCYASERPLVVVPTLDALAHRLIDWCDEEKVVCAVLDAKRDEVYSAWYEKRGQRMEKKSSDCLSRREDFLRSLASKSSIVLTGEDAERLLEQLNRLGGIAIAPSELRRASARAVAALGLQLLREGKTADVSSVEPTYLKEFLVKL